MDNVKLLNLVYKSLEKSSSELQTEEDYKIILSEDLIVLDFKDKSFCIMVNEI